MPKRFFEIFKNTAFIAVLMLCLVNLARAEEEAPFEIIIKKRYGETYGEGEYRQPARNLIKIQYAEIRMFLIVIKNVSSETQELKVEGSQGIESNISFEIEDENNNQNVITKKMDPQKARISGNTDLGPGKTREFEVLLSPAEWDNVFNLMKKGGTKFRARAVYQDGSRKIYSDYYDLVYES